MSELPLGLRVLAGRYAVCRLPAGQPVPTWATVGGLAAVVVTAEETSVVCDEAVVPDEVVAERGWAALVVDGPLDLGLTGVLASLAVPLRDAEVPIFVVSTYDTDYVLVPGDRLERAVDALRVAGFGFTPLAT